MALSPSHTPKPAQTYLFPISQKNYNRDEVTREAKLVFRRKKYCAF